MAINIRKPSLTACNRALGLTAMLLSCASAAIATAQETAPTPPAEGTPVLSTVIVNGKRERSPDSYSATRSGTAMKTDTPLLDTPQSITVVTQGQIRDQAMQSIADAVRYVPGLGMANGEGNRDSPYFRGVTNASGDLYIDGVRDDVEYYRDLYNIDRVEVLTGPNAMIFGRAGSGGIINRVTKQADFAALREARLTLGTYQNRRLTADIDQPVSDTAAVRVTGLVEDSGGFQTNYYLRRAGVNPTAAFRLDNATTVSIGYELFRDERVGDRGIPSFRGRPLDVPVNQFFGDPDPASRPIHVTVDAASALVEHDFGGGFTLRNNTRYMVYDKTYQNYNAGAVNAAGTTVQLSAYNNHQLRKNAFNQTDLNFALQTGAIKHTFLVGAEFGQQDTDYLRKSGTFTNANGATTITIPLANPAFPIPVNYVLGATASDRDGHSRATVAAAYGQDQIQLTPQWQAVLGARFDDFRLDYHNNVDSSTLASNDRLTSPRAGLIYKPLEPVSLYASYGVAYFPRGGDQLSGLTAVNQSFAPEKFKNYEAGAKWDINPLLQARLAVYKLDRSNVAVPDAVNAGQFVLVDGQVSKGVELGVSGNITRAWSIVGGYAHQSAKLTATASATAQNGATVALVPKNLVSLWNRYNFNPAWGAALGVIHSSDVFTSTSNAVTLPAYTRVDGAVYYTLSRTTQLQLNVENLNDRKYYISANNDTNITPGSPRTYRVTASMQF